MRYLMDTNIVIYYFSGLTDDESIHTLLADSFNISIITKIEFLGWSQFAVDAQLHDATAIIPKDGGFRASTHPTQAWDGICRLAFAGHLIKGAGYQTGANQ